MSINNSSIEKEKTPSQAGNNIVTQGSIQQTKTSSNPGAVGGAATDAQQK